MKTIELTIDASGNVKAETKGFNGPACKSASAFIESALGKTTSEQRTAAFYSSASAGSHIQTKGK